MKVNGLNSSGYLEQVSKNKKQDNREFANSFAGNLAESTINHEEKEGEKTGHVKKEHGIRYAAMASGINVCNPSGFGKSGIKECDVKNISYSESDNVKVCVENGYVLKAKLDESRNIVYVERKNEDGTIEAYEADLDVLDKNSDNPVVRMALETAGKSSGLKSAAIEEDFHAAILKFSEYVQERIENGPPKFQIGSMSISIEKWNKLIEELDEQIDEIKQELRERVEKQEQEDKNKVSEEELIKKLLEDKRYTKSDKIFKMGTATREATGNGDGKNIGVMAIDNQAYLAQYSENSTSAKPIVKVGDYEISVNDVDPENATEIEMFALMSHLDKTGQSRNEGMSSFSKMRTYSQQAECNGFCSGIADTDEAWNSKRNWIEIIENARKTYSQSLIPEIYALTKKCDNLLHVMQKWIGGILG